MSAVGQADAAATATPKLQFRILGPLEAWREGAIVDLGARKQRAVLALLLLNANRVVPTQRLIDELWGDTPPETARSALQVYVAGFRTACAPTERGARAVSRHAACRPFGRAVRGHRGRAARRAAARGARAADRGR